MVQILRSLSNSHYSSRQSKLAKFRKIGSKNKFRRVLGTLTSNPLATVVGAKLSAKVLDGAVGRLYSAGAERAKQIYGNLRNKPPGLKPAPQEGELQPSVSPPILKSKQSKDKRIIEKPRKK